jgi:Rieske Fe-S protein
MTPPPEPAPSDTAATPEASRRGFIAGVWSIIIGGLLALAPIAAGIVFFLDPLLRKRPTMKGGSADGFLPVAKLTELPADGTPLRFSIIADKIDKWNLFRQQTVGTVYLRNVGGNVIAFNDVCPHLGCKVDYKGASKSFYCPCHASAFDLEGKPTNAIPPRPMDSLKVRVESDGTVWVQYANYQRGKAEKIPVA